MEDASSEEMDRDVPRPEHNERADVGSFALGVSLDRVGVRFPSNPNDTLRELSLQIQPGELISLVGASGCGKSTVLRVIAGLLPPTCGAVQYDPRIGRSTWRPSSAVPSLPLESNDDPAVRGPRGCSDNVPSSSKASGRRQNAVTLANGQIGFVFQHATLLPWRTALQNVVLPLELRRTPWAQAWQIAREACSLVKLKDSDLQKLPRMLSGGMQMRVSMARALVTNPSLMLLDEPFAAIDDLLRHQLNDDLLQIWQERGWTSVFVTHHLAEAVYLSQRVVVMAGSPGQIVGQIQIPFPYPRTHALRSSPAFATFVADVDAVLRGKS